MGRVTRARRQLMAVEQFSGQEPPGSPQLAWSRGLRASKALSSRGERGKDGGNQQTELGIIPSPFSNRIVLSRS
jgi:hypothetical protein